MKARTINLRDLTILIADSNSYLLQVTRDILRGFGANKLLLAQHSSAVLETLAGQKIDILLCDAGLPPEGGGPLVRNIRHNPNNENRTIPIMMMMTDTREHAIKHARDAGANMVIAKPISRKSLYERLAWIALDPRAFVDSPAYFGPDRRFKIDGYPGGVGRRKADQAVEVAGESDGTLQGSALVEPGKSDAKEKD